jgi:hypothetical protein
MYKIVCDDLDVKFNYVGSTQNFTRSKCQHKRNSNDKKKAHMKLYKIINENGGWSNFSMIKIETCYCKTTLDARTRERYFFEELNATMNNYRPLRTTEETKEMAAEWCKQYYIDHKAAIKEHQTQYNIDHKAEIKEKQTQYHNDHKAEIKEYHKQYSIDNKDYQKEYKKQYRNDNKGEIKEYQKEYQNDNKEAIASKKKDYRINNKETIASRNSELIHCEACNSYHSRGNISKHSKTKKHQANINKIENHSK